jgi:hypothetical protein
VGHTPGLWPGWPAAPSTVATGQKLAQQPVFIFEYFFELFN